MFFLSDILPCPEGSIDQCMSDNSSKLIFAFQVYNPYILNGQLAPRIMVLLNGQSSKGVLPTVLKTCLQPDIPIIVKSTVAVQTDQTISWALKDRGGYLFDTGFDICKRLEDRSRCIALASDRAADDRCPSASYTLTSPMRIYPSYDCYDEEITLEKGENGLKYCGTRAKGNAPLKLS